MELIAAILLAGPLGYFVRTRRRALASYLAVWAVLFPIQTIVVHNANPDDIEPLYFVINVAILAGGVALNTLGARLRDRSMRASRTPTSPTLR